MERKIVLLNGSQRAPKSNSRRYAAIFREHCPVAADYFEITRRNHAMLCSKMDEYTDVVLVFPLYADSLPVSLLDFLKSLEAARSERRPTVSVMINCGFLEYEQNMVAMDMVRLFCRRNGYPFGSVLMIGGGEAILDTPFRLLAGRRIAAFARAVAEGRAQSMHVTMPITKRMFVWASDIYWRMYGRRHGVSKRQMESMRIE